MAKRQPALILDLDEIPEAKASPDPRKRMIDDLYSNRKRRMSHPEGEFDKHGRFYPSKRENADGDGCSVRSPSFQYPYSYMLRCRTRVHCSVLVDRAIQGLEVPYDVLAIVQRTLGTNKKSVWDRVLQEDAL